MRVLMTGGGTAGHINPALAIADRIRREWPDTEFLFVGCEGRMETRLVPEAGYRLMTMKVRGFQRKLTPKAIAGNLAAVWQAAAAQQKSRRILREFRPDLAIGTGGYVCGPILRCAAAQGIPVVLHESNAFPGVTVKLLAKDAAAVLLATEAARPYLPKNCHAVVTGNPLRRGFSTPDKAAARQVLGLSEKPLVLSFGGSLGAAALNHAMVEVLVCGYTDGRAQYVHGTGRSGFDEMVQALQKKGLSPEMPGLSVRPYIQDMPTYMAAADLVICRCGAMTISELPAAGKPSILIPSPYVAENHQYHNAMSLVKKDAAVCLEEKDLTGARLWQEIEALLSDPVRRQKMAENAHSAAVLDADDRIMAEIRTVLGR